MATEDFSFKLPIHLTNITHGNKTLPDYWSNRQLGLKITYEFDNTFIKGKFYKDFINYGNNNLFGRNYLPTKTLLWESGNRPEINGTFRYSQINSDQNTIEDITSRFIGHYDNVKMSSTGWASSNFGNAFHTSNLNVKTNISIRNITHEGVNSYEEYKYDFIRESPHTDVVKTLRVSNKNIRLTPVKDIMTRRSGWGGAFDASPFYVHRGYRDAMFYIIGNNNNILIDHDVRCDPILFNFHDGKGGEWQSAFFIEGTNNTIIFNIKEDFCLYNAGNNGELGGTNWASSDRC